MRVMNVVGARPQFVKAVALSGSIVKARAAARIEIVESGRNVPLRDRPHHLAHDVEAALSRTFTAPPQPYGDGQAALRSLQLVMAQPW